MIRPTDAVVREGMQLARDWVRARPWAFDLWAHRSMTTRRRYAFEAKFYMIRDLAEFEDRKAEIESWLIEALSID